MVVRKEGNYTPVPEVSAILLNEITTQGFLQEAGQHDCPEAWHYLQLDIN